MSEEPVTERDYLKEMDDILDEATRGSGWVPAIVASQVYARLLTEDPELIEGWLHATAADTLRRMITGRAHAARMRERARAERGEFADAAKNFEKGEDANGAKLQGMFALLHTVSPDDVRKRAGEMTGKDHLYVAEEYEQNGKRALMKAAFHRAIAHRVGDRRTDEVIDLDTYEAMYASITSQEKE